MKVDYSEFMKNHNELMKKHYQSIVDCANTPNSQKQASLMTKREMIAMHAMQAITPNCLSMNLSQADVAESIAKQSIAVADALLKELEK